MPVTAELPQLVSYARDTVDRDVMESVRWNCATSASHC